MDWIDILKFLCGYSVILAAVGWVVKSIATHFLDRELEKLKERLKATQQRVDRLESELLKSRGAAYDEIWGLTGAVNLFGSTISVNYDELSRELTHWYFPKGRLLTEDAKSLYFLVQEVLNFLSLRNIPLKRPSGEILFGGKERAIDAVRAYRTRLLKVAERDKESSYTFKELVECVVKCKQEILPASNETESSEVAWLLLQFVMSAFRSLLVDELGSRAPVDVRPDATKHK
jgi:hypothetical protein